jgi:hypothetical protein
VAITTAAQIDVLGYTHAFVSAYLRQRFSPPIAEPLNIAAYELLDNALSYGSVSEPVRLEIIESSFAIAIRVTNASIAARIDMLTVHIDRLRIGQESIFIEEMRRAVGGGITRPMLGLARLVFEAALDLELYVDDHRATVIARRHK